MDWNLCVICQTKSSEELRCPIRLSFDANRPPLNIYTAFLNNVQEFRKLDSLPVPIYFGEEVTAQEFMERKASWHKHCHQKFNSSMLERVKHKESRKRKQTEGEYACRPKRHSTARQSTVCIFCGSTTPEILHEFTTFNMDKSIRDMATDMCDNELLVKISDVVDLVASESKYHMSCLTKYRNRYRAFQRAQAASSSSSSDKQGRDRAFAELVMHVESALEQGTYMFPLAELHAAYEERLKEFNIDTSINRSRLKKELLDFFQKYEIQEQSDGKRIILIFPDGMQELLHSTTQCKSEVVQMASVAKIIRDEMFQTECKFKFDGHFPSNCQKDSVPYKLKLLVSMILNGPSLKNEDISIDSQNCLTISQLLLFNARKKEGSLKNKGIRHSLDREPPLPVYISLNIHSLVRSKKLIEQLHDLGIAISYDRVLQLESDMALSMCKQYQANDVVCPSHLKKKLFTVGVMDNIDHDPSSTTATSSFHGTGISIIQLPTEDNEGTAVEVVSTAATEGITLPNSYSVVPAVALNQSKATVMQRQCESFSGNLEQHGKLREKQWLENAFELLKTDLESNKPLTWSSFHASRQSQAITPPVITALLPLFTEKADTPAMIKHAMDILMSATSFLNPGQVPVMACDCPIYAKAKFVQWTWPSSHGEDKLVVMFGGLHLEMGMWNMLGDYLAGSGWTTALTDAGIATAGTADSFLKSSHLARTRHAHQVTCVALDSLQRQAFQKDELNGSSFEVWKENMIRKSPTFQYWDTILSIEMLILVFIRAHRENNFPLYVEALEAIVGYFFAFDRYNYARWVPVHIRDMTSLPASLKEEFQKKWVGSKGHRRFSNIPFDHMHEQENAKVKGKGGVIGLTENAVALRRWMICGPELARCISEFENESEENDSPLLHHHEEGFAAQLSFKQQAQSLIDTINGFGNPFEDDCPELLVLNTRVCADDSVIETVKSLEGLAKKKYQEYKKEVLTEQSKSINDTIKKNSLALFSSPKRIAKSKTSQQLAVQRNNASLFGRLYIANQQREGDPAEFFSHENQTTPPSLSDFGKIRLGQKSLLLSCVDPGDQSPCPLFDCKIFDGAAVVHFLSPKTTNTFADYADQVFIPFFLQQLEGTSRVDLVWDRYLANSIKGLTREHRGSGVRIKVSSQSKIPKKWEDFLRDTRNKTELFSFLSAKVTKVNVPEHKSVYVTSGIANYM